MSWKDNSFFVESMKDVAKWEGGYVNNPNDPGGATNFGISLRFYQENIDPMATEKTIQHLKKDDAYEIYYKHFWQVGGYDRYNFSVAKRVFNFGVNMGIRRANKLLQRAIWAATGTELEIDGIIGNKTLSTLKNARPEAVVAALKSEAAGRYRYLALKNPELKVFLKGWLRRAYS